MIERFLAYSLRWNCPIKLVWLAQGQMKSGNITVVRLNGSGFEYVTSRKKKTPQALQLADVLAAAYARGDDGDTSRKTSLTEKEGSNEG